MQTLCQISGIEFKSNSIKTTFNLHDTQVLVLEAMTLMFGTP